MESGTPKPQVRPQTFLLPNHEETIEEIWKMHAPATVEVDTEILFSRMFSVISKANPFNNIGYFKGKHNSYVEMGMRNKVMNMLKPMPFIINKIFYEMIMHCSCGRDAHATTMSTLQSLGCYSWDEKVVLSLAGFKMSLIQLFPYNSSSPLAEYMSPLLQLPHSINPMPETLMDDLSRIESIMVDTSSLLVLCRTALRLTVVETSPALGRILDCVPMTVYWIVRAVVACITMMIGFSVGYNLEDSFLFMEPLGLEGLNGRIAEKYNYLKQQANSFINEKTKERECEDKKKLQATETLEELYRKPDHADNQEILQALLGSNAGVPPLVYYSKEREFLSQVHIEILKGKTVLLLITKLTADPNNLQNHEIDILKQIYQEKLQHPTRKESQFEIVWVPIPRSSEPNPEFNFDQLKLDVPWYAVAQPWAMDLKAINHIKKAWRFNNSPILVVLDAKGKVVHLNALSMVMVWGKTAFPFTSDREESLWNKEAWNLKLLVDGIDPLILQWVKEDKLICLYGGNDMETIRKLTTKAKLVAKTEAMSLEMVYVGASTCGKQVIDIITAISKEKLSHSWKNLDSINYFWTRLHRMWLSRKLQDDKPLNTTDPKWNALTKLLAFDSNAIYKGWVIFSAGSSAIAAASGDIAVKCLSYYDAWKERAKRDSFLEVLKEEIRTLSPKGFNAEIVIPEATIGPTARILQPVIPEATIGPTARILQPTPASKRLICQQVSYRCIMHGGDRYGKVRMR